MEQIAVDPAVIPPGIIQRVETILDGNSAIYGSDAIGGVINFITRKKFEGVRLDARYGMGDSYNSFDANATAGIGWGSGSVVATYSFAKNDAIFGRDRDYNRSINWQTGTITPGQRTCTPPYHHFRRCQLCRLRWRRAPIFATRARMRRVSSEEYARHTGYASLSQDITDGIVFDLDGFYSDRTIDQWSVPGRPYDQWSGSNNARRQSIANPFFRPIPSKPGTNLYTANFNYAPAFESTHTRSWHQELAGNADDYRRSGWGLAVFAPWAATVEQDPI